MRTKILRGQSNGAKLMLSANGVHTMEVGIPNVALALFKKPSQKASSFLGNIPTFLEGSEDLQEECDIALITTLRDPDCDVPLQVANKIGNMYPIEVVVLATGGTRDISKAAIELANTCTSIAKNECKAEWKYGIPVFLYKGDITPVKVLPLSHYIVSTDCVIVMKRIYEGITTKELFLQKDDRDLILKDVFGNVEHGLDVINKINEEVFDAL